ncbi:uncharacterized protein plekhg4 [Kryptolebias marmoratus]|uniref:uncharacterized protein plekhg4 n=1 Tax=Kryptolebias marmoratus TaxID=37003 RepID=UPI0018ACFFAE|nr:uncharacterized protein plekhg4 [Kryptolebias marmoratus]
MDSESLDHCIQKALAALYPPFQATSSTVLGQVLSVVDSCYKGDGLCYLLHFLLPAKHFLQNLQQVACSPYCGLLFCHEGWPLCLQEKVVVQLCPLDQQLLRPGDFYLLVSPPAAPQGHSASCRSSVDIAPRLLLCSVSSRSRHVEQQEVSREALRSLFSMSWLDSVNRERERRGATRLECCVLSAQGDVFRLPWEDVVYPQFISRSQTTLPEDKGSLVKDGDDLSSSRQEIKLLPFHTGQSAASSGSEDSEGEYVELSELPLPQFYPQKGSLTQSISLQNFSRTTANTHKHVTKAQANTHMHVTEVHANTHANTPYMTETQANIHAKTHANNQKHLTETHTYTHAKTHPNTHKQVTDAHPNTHANTQKHKTEAHANTHSNTHQHATEANPNTNADTEKSMTETHANIQKHVTKTHITTHKHVIDTYANRHTDTQKHLTKAHITTQKRATDTYPNPHANTQKHVTKTHANTHANTQNHKTETHTKTKTHVTKIHINTRKHLTGTYAKKHVNTRQHVINTYTNTQKQMTETHCGDTDSESNTQSSDSNTHSEGNTHSFDNNTHLSDSNTNSKSNTHFFESNTHSSDSNIHSEGNTHSSDSNIHSEGNTHSSDSNIHSEGNTHSSDSNTHSEGNTHPFNSNTHSFDSNTHSKGITHFFESNTHSSGSNTHSKGITHFFESNTHSSGSNTNSDNNTHSSFSIVEVSPRLLEENFSQDPCGDFVSLASSSDPLEAKDEPKVYSHESPPAQSKANVSAGTSPTEPEQPQTRSNAVQFQFSKSCQSSFYSQLLRSGAVCLPGTKDRGGRALLTVCCLSPVWFNPYCDTTELVRLLLYYTFTLRKEVRASGLTVLVDARRAAPPLVLFSALRLLQDNTPGSIHTMVILVNKESFLRLDKPAFTQVEVLRSLKSLQKHVELQQLPADFGGSFIFSQNSWISFRLRVDQLTNQCKDVIHLLQKNINFLQSTSVPAPKQDPELLMSRYKAVMSSILEDVQLVQLQQEGGASLSVLRREEGGDGVSEEQRAAVEEVSSLYDEVDELLHRLVTLSNAKTQELNYIIDFRNLEQEFSLIRTWLEEVGEVRLKALNEPADSLELLNKKQQDFKDFYTTAYDHCKRGEALLARLEHWDNMSADLSVYEVKVHSFWAQLQDFSQRVKSTENNIDRSIQLYCFLDQAYGWALEGMHHLAGISMENCTTPDKCQAVIDILEEYQQKHPPISDSRFQEMKAEAGELQGEHGLNQWSFAWSKCQETKKMFDRKMEAVLRTRDSSHRRRSNSANSRSSISSRKSLSGLWGIQESSSCPLDDETSTMSPVFSASPPTPHHTPLLRRLFRSSFSFTFEESSERQDNFTPSPSLTRLNSSSSFSTFSSPSFSPLSSPSFSSSSSRRKQMRKTQSFDCPSTPDVLRYSVSPRTLSEPPRRGNTGVFIRGLEVSSTEAADQTLCPRTPAHNWMGQRPHSPRTPGSPTVDIHHRGRLRHIVEEMVTTEREYVRSLRYIIHHYFPEMDRADLPQGLRGKRSVIFGNLEKLLDFHNQFFLRELEACWKHPLRVPHCFLRHEEQFGLYALYSKNKPKSDALLANHGHAFFRRKQLELGDKMDLSSYLLKPIQRMSKYALLLTDLMKEVGTAQEAELTALQAATNMVKFQLRHGNDLLAMDAIRDCDVNLKEQGQLIRQDEFTVLSGRRKCQRHIFLFEELILFSKPKKMEGGLDVFIYKHSFKTADVGLTESTGDSGLRFEIWFRRRTSKNQTFVLQATTAEVKHTWTTDIARILWTQATRNKEMRLKEMVSMGVGNKPFLDIQPSDAAISDRAVHYIMKNRGARTRASIAVSVFDHSQPFKREAVTSDPAASGPSSCSLLGPLNLHMYSQLPPAVPPADSSFSSSCIEEDEQEHETSSQPSMTTESSGSSSRCLSGSTGSDSGCVSSPLQEALLGQSGPSSQPSSSSSSSSSHHVFHHHHPRHRYHSSTLPQQAPARLSSISSHDSGFISSSQDQSASFKSSSSPMPAETKLSNGFDHHSPASPPYLHSNGGSLGTAFPFFPPSSPPSSASGPSRSWSRPASALLPDFPNYCMLGSPMVPSSRVPSWKDWAKPGPYDQPMVNTLRRKKDKDTLAAVDSNGSVNGGNSPLSGHASVSAPPPAVLQAPSLLEEKNRMMAAPLKADHIEARDELTLVLSRGLELDTQRSSRDSIQCSSGYSTQTNTPCCSEDTIPSQVSDYDYFSMAGDQEAEQQQQSDFDKSSTIPRNSDISQSYRRMFQTKRPASTAGLPSTQPPYPVHGGPYPPTPNHTGAYPCTAAGPYPPTPTGHGPIIVTPGVATIRRTPSSKPSARRSGSMGAGPIPICTPVVPVKPPTVPDVSGAPNGTRSEEEAAVGVGEPSSRSSTFSGHEGVRMLPVASWSGQASTNPPAVAPPNQLPQQGGEEENMLVAIRKGVKLKRTLTNDRSAPLIA